MAKRGIKFEHSVGEVVLCFEPDPTKARVLYDAKVLDSQVSKDKDGRKCAAYLVHFQGWNNSWDRLVPESFILKASEDNKALMKRLTETAKKHRKNRQRRRKINQILRDANVKAPPQYDSESNSDSSTTDDDSDSENDDSNQSHSENGRRNRVRKKQQARHTQENPPVTIDIPDIMKSRLEDDYTAVSIRGKLCSLPAKPCVVDILEGFVKTFCVNYICEPIDRDPLAKEREKTRTEKHVLYLPAEDVFSMCKELVDGLRILFDFTLPIILLYATEQEQYENVMKNTNPEEVFGGQEIEVSSAMLESKVESKSDTKPRRGRPPSQKNRRAEFEVGETACTADATPRRMTRRSTVDSHFSDEPAATVSAKRQKKQEGVNSPKLSPRTLRRRGLHEEPLAIKVEDNSDTEIEFSPPASTSTTNNGTSHPWVQGVAPESVESIGQLHKKREDLTDSILTWQIVPTHVRRQPPVSPSQVYGIHHLLRLFVKLPEMLNRMPFDKCKLQVLVKLCHHCLQYLVDHQQEFFT